MDLPRRVLVALLMDAACALQNKAMTVSLTVSSAACPGRFFGFPRSKVQALWCEQLAQLYIYKKVTPVRMSRIDPAKLNMHYLILSQYSIYLNLPRCAQHFGHPNFAPLACQCDHAKPFFSAARQVDLSPVFRPHPTSLLDRPQIERAERAKDERTKPPRRRPSVGPSVEGQLI